MVVTEEPDDVVVEPLVCDVLGEALHVVGDVAVGEVVQQHAAALGTALPGRQEERSLVLGWAERQ